MKTFRRKCWAVVWEHGHIDLYQNKKDADEDAGRSLTSDFPLTIIPVEIREIKTKKGKRKCVGK